MEEPPLEAGAVKEMLALVCEVAPAATLLGASEMRAAVVIEFEAEDGADTPALLVAVTLKV